MFPAIIVRQFMPYVRMVALAHFHRVFSITYTKSSWFSGHVLPHLRMKIRHLFLRLTLKTSFRCMMLKMVSPSSLIKLSYYFDFVQDVSLVLSQLRAQSPMFLLHLVRLVICTKSSFNMSNLITNSSAVIAITTTSVTTFGSPIHATGKPIPTTSTTPAKNVR